MHLALIIDSGGKKFGLGSKRQFAEENLPSFDSQTGREIIITRITPPAEFTFGVAT